MKSLNLPPSTLKQMKNIAKASYDLRSEYGALLCKSPSSHIHLSEPCKGTACGVKIDTLKCPPSTIQHGTFHTHPTNSDPSPHDVALIALEANIKKTPQVGCILSTTLGDMFCFEIKPSHLTTDNIDNLVKIGNTYHNSIKEYVTNKNKYREQILEPCELIK